MRVLWILMFLTVIVIFLVAAVLWSLMPTGLNTWEAILVFAVDFLGVVWVLSLIAVAVMSLLRRSAVGREALSGGGPSE